MAVVTKRIGLSLGADICWARMFEEVLRRLDLELPVSRRERVRFEVERVTIEPYALDAPRRYDVLLDRLTHWYVPAREWVKKAAIADGTYVLNNPWAIQSMEKHTTYAAMLRLGLPIPPTWIVPPKAYEPAADLQVTLQRYARLFDLGELGRKVGYPLFMKPYDGGAWVGVSRIEDEAQLRAAYEASGKRVMHLQAAVAPFDLFVRVLAVGPQARLLKYDPSAPLHLRYCVEAPDVTDAERRTLEDMTLTINTFFGWDFNSCEALRQGSTFHPIDFANACPDSQVTSLHRHHPWLVAAKLRWALFVAATGRRMQSAMDWQPYFDVADQRDLPFAERLSRYAAIARKRLEADRFAEFCATHLPQLDRVVWEAYGSDVAHEAVRQKVASLFPAHEVDRFTAHFWDKVQAWRAEQAPTA